MLEIVANHIKQTYIIIDCISIFVNNVFKLEWNINLNISSFQPGEKYLGNFYGQNTAKKTCYFG